MLLRGPKSIDIPTAADGDGHAIKAAAGVTSTWAPGDYWYSVRATNGDDVVELEKAQLTIAPDIANMPEGYDGMTYAERTLAAIEAVIAGRATMDQERYRINNRELYRTRIADLLAFRDRFRMEVRREKAAACGNKSFGTKVRVSLR